MAVATLYLDDITSGLTLFLDFGRRQVLYITFLNVEGLIETLNLLQDCSFVSRVTKPTCLLPCPTEYVRTYHRSMSSTRQSKIDTRTCEVSQTLYRTRPSITGADGTTDEDNLDGGKPKRFNISHSGSSMKVLN